MRAPLATGNSTGSLAAELATAHISPETETVVTASTKATTGENVPLSEIETTPETEPDIPYRLDKQGACYLLPKCHHPPQEEMNPVENFVEKAVKEFMELPDNDTSRSNSYRVLVGTIKTKNDPPMLYKIFLAIRTAGNGSTLHQLSGNPAKHGQLMHVLLRFNPFVAPFKPARSDSKKGQPKTPEKESSDRDEEWAKMTKCFEDYSLADAYFHLILALISANSVNAVPAITAVWKLLVAYSGARGPPLAR